MVLSEHRRGAFKGYNGQIWEAFVLSSLHKCPCSCCCHHLLAPTLEIITFICWEGESFHIIIQELLLCSHFSLSLLHLCIPPAPAHLNFLDVAPTESSGRLQLCNKLLSVSSLPSAKNINFRQRGVFLKGREGITAQGGEAEVRYGDKGHVTLMGTPLRSSTPPH